MSSLCCGCSTRNPDSTKHSNGTIVKSGEPGDVKTEQPISVMELPLEIYKTATVNIVEKKFGFSDYSVVIKAGSAVGDNYMGIVYRIAVTDNESGQCKNIILKIPPQNAARQKEFQTHFCFLKEITIYEEVLPMFENFQRSKGISVEDGFHEYAECYGSLSEDSQEGVYFEDLKQAGFEMFSRFEEPTLGHAKLLMEALGKFHALSLAMKDQAKGRFDKYREMKDLMDNGDSENKLSGAWTFQLKKAIDCLDPEKHADVVKKLQVILDPATMGDTIKDCVNGKVMEQYAVICHGDCWNNNMLFKNDKDGNPIGIRLLDFQISRYSSPALDILYYLYCSTHKTLRDKHYFDLLHIYHRSVSQMLTLLGSDAEKVFPYSAIKSELKRVGKFGLLMSAIIVPMMVQQPGQTIDMDKMVENMNNNKVVDLLQMEGDLKNTYNVRMRDIILDINRFGYLG